MTNDEINIIGNILNQTWGKSSTNKMGASQVINGKLIGDAHLILSYTCIASIGNPFERNADLKKLEDESTSILNSALKKIKDEFKSESGRTLKTKQMDSSVDWQLLNLGQYSGRRDGRFMRVVSFEIE